jgi:hypothetical protein
VTHDPFENPTLVPAKRSGDGSTIVNLSLFNIDNLRSAIHYPLTTQAMKSTAAFRASLLLAATGAEAKPLRVFILAGHS